MDERTEVDLDTWVLGAAIGSVVPSQAPPSQAVTGTGAGDETLDDQEGDDRDDLDSDGSQPRPNQQPISKRHLRGRFRYGTPASPVTSYNVWWCQLPVIERVPYSGRLETKEDERRLAEECAALGPLLGGVGRRGEKSRVTLARIVRAIASGEVRQHCERRERALQVSALTLLGGAIPAGPSHSVTAVLTPTRFVPQLLKSQAQDVHAGQSRSAVGADALSERHSLPRPPEAAVLPFSSLQRKQSGLQASLAEAVDGVLDTGLQVAALSPLDPLQVHVLHECRH